MKLLIKSLLFMMAISASLLYGAPPQKVVQTAADREVLQDLLKQVDAHTGHYTQSEAHLSVKAVRDSVSVTPGLEKNRKVIQEATARERELRDGYYVFYTAVPHLRLFQDVTRKLYKHKVGNKGALQQRAFQFLRYTYKDKIYDEYPNVTYFLIKEITESGVIDDNDPRLKAHLVSTNVAFWGNIHSTGESTWYYFNHPQPWVSVSIDWMKACLKSFGYPEVYAQKLISLARLTTYDQGDLFQIFIPRHLMDQIGYVSWRQGVPFDTEILTSWFGRKTLGVGSWILHDEIKERVYNLRRKWKAGDESVKDQVALMLDRIKKGSYSLVPLLDNYKVSGPKSIEDMQARLLVTNEGLLNPESGIKIYRYSNLPADKLAEYKKKLRQVMLEMEAHKKRVMPRK